MEVSIIFAGFVGQGVLFAGQLLAYAGMDDKKNVTWIPSYGPEMRGGTANCTVIIGDEPIGSPIVTHPDIALVFNRPSFDKYEPLVKNDGLLVVNNAIVDVVSEREELETVYVPANTIAEETCRDQGSNIKMLNMAMVGAMLARRSFLTLGAVEDALRNHLPASKAHLLDGNLAVLRHGYEAARLQVLDAPRSMRGT